MVIRLLGSFDVIVGAGQVRLINRVAGTLSLYDIARDGRVLLSRDNTRLAIVGRAPGETTERDLSWLDWSIARDLSDDGRTLLFTEAGEGAGTRYGVYLRRMDGSPAVRLGDGSAMALSPDGRWALANARTTPRSSSCCQTKQGLARRDFWSWVVRSIICRGRAGSPMAAASSSRPASRDVPPRLYVQGIAAGGLPRAVTPAAETAQIFSAHSIAPDGQIIAAINHDQRIFLYPVAGGEPRPVPGTEPGEVPVRWTPDGRALYVFRRGELPARIYQLDLATGERQFRKELLPLDPVGVHEILRILLTPDLSAYAYTYTRDLSDLYLVGGLG